MPHLSGRPQRQSGSTQSRPHSHPVRRFGPQARPSQHGSKETGSLPNGRDLAWAVSEELADSSLNAPEEKKILLDSVCRKEVDSFVEMLPPGECMLALRMSRDVERHPLLNRQARLSVFACLPAVFNCNPEEKFTAQQSLCVSIQALVLKIGRAHV